MSDPPVQPPVITLPQSNSQINKLGFAARRWKQIGRWYRKFFVEEAYIPKEARDAIVSCRVSRESVGNLLPRFDGRSVGLFQPPFKVHHFNFERGKLIVL